MQESAQIATLAKAIEEERELNSPNTVKVVFNQLGNALYFSRYAIPFQRNISTDVIHYKHIGMYAFNMKTFLQIIKLPLSPLENAESLEQLRWLDAGFKISIGITNFESIGIDTPEDLTEALKRL
jgi:3-deoxy-manno-octulosonate cytidylyltransferase (CMP-KDO synthetase)